MSGGESGRWCHVCATRHELGPKCPGELLATGPERHGWKVHVMNESRRETYGVLIAEADDLWRARVLTFPSMLWCVPGGRKPMKIVGRSPQEVERHARFLIEAHCKSRGLKFAEDSARVKVGKIDHNAADSGAQPRGAQDARLLQAIPVQFGEQKPDRSGTTSDISKGGLFIATKKPLPKGRKVRIVLKLESASIPLAGAVMWTRVKPEPERPSGMGIRLIAPPALYQHYVRELTQDAGIADPAEPPATVGGDKVVGNAEATGATGVPAAAGAPAKPGAPTAAGAPSIPGTGGGSDDANEELDFEFDFSAPEP